MGKSSGGKGKKRDGENGEIPRITKTCTAVLVGNDGSRLPMGDFTLTEPEPGPTIENFADAAHRSARSSLSRLMTPQWRIVVIDGKVEQGFGLERWFKLTDGRKTEERRAEGKGGKLAIHRKATV